MEPVELNLDSEFQFHCHKGIACFNACCKNIDIQMTPYDIVRLKQRLEMNSSEFLSFPHDRRAKSTRRPTPDGNLRSRGRLAKR